jgi:hypothetical protein
MPICKKAFEERGDGYNTDPIGLVPIRGDGVLEVEKESGLFISRKAS